MVGTTVTKATAHNAKYIFQNKIGKGAKVQLIRSNDVIPKIMEVLSPATSGKADMPNVDYVWNDTEVDIMPKHISKDLQDKITIKLLIHFFKKMGVKYLSEGIITKLADKGYNSVEKILTAKKQDLYNIEGLGSTMVDKIYSEIDKAFSNVKLETFMAASHKFGRGLGETKIREIIKRYPDILIKKWSASDMTDNIMKVDGFSDKTSELFVKNFDAFMEFYNSIAKIKDLSRFEKVVVKSNKTNLFDGKTIVFTGFRDTTLEQIIIDNGGKVSSSVSKNTFIVVHADNEDSSSKLDKARKLDVPIINKTDFMAKYVK